MSWRILAAVGVVLSLADVAVAQPQLGPPSRPAFSPYLNLVRPGGSPALNYYGLVRPEIQARQAINNLQGAVTNNQQAIGDIQTGLNDLPGTGHTTAFMNYGSYFQTNGQNQFGGGSGVRNTNQAFLSTNFNRLPAPGGTGVGGRLGVPQATPRR